MEKNFMIQDKLEKNIVVPNSGLSFLLYKNAFYYLKKKKHSNLNTSLQAENMMFGFYILWSSVQNFS